MTMREEVISQIELDDTAHLPEQKKAVWDQYCQWLREATEQHPLPEGAERVECSELCQHFLRGKMLLHFNCEPESPEVKGASHAQT